MEIILKDISYYHPDREPLFRGISFSILKGQKASLIGNNGSGKSTLLRIIAGELEAFSGELAVDDKLYFVPQHFGQFDRITVAEALRIDRKIAALQAILGGDVSAENFNALEDDWSIEERVSAAFSLWGLREIPLSQEMKTLSGGEKTKVFLAGIDIHAPSVILMDEPTNHLDTDYRQQLYKLVENSKSTMLVVSHDRTLLHLFDLTFELNKEGVEVYGGNYEFYRQLKDEKTHALQARLDAKEKELRKAKKTAREVAERAQKQDGRGEKRSLKKGTPRIMMNTLKNKAEQSTSKLKEVHSEKMGDIAGDIKEIRNRIPGERALQMDFGDAGLHTGKILVDAEAVNFAYSSRMLWKDPLTFRILSGDRMVIHGKNGSGKTTLLKLITGQLEPASGVLKKSDFHYVYIDQEYSMINNELTVYEQAQQFNARNLPEHEVKTLLTRFLLPHPMWDKICGILSGGEKMKLLFCCLAVGNHAPDMFILDEPTNNIDIQGMEIMTKTLQSYRGTLLVISHDLYFIEEIRINRSLTLTADS